MIKWICGLSLGVGLLGATSEKIQHKSHIFVGVMSGFETYRLSIASKHPWTNSFLWGIKAGYQYDLVKYAALRVDLSYIMGLKPTAFHTLVHSFLSLNMDVVSDFYKIGKYDLGAYAGLGFGYFQGAPTLVSTDSNRSFMGYNGVFNLGVGSTIEQRHRVELGVKIPFGKTKAVIGKGFYSERFYWVASYAYLF
ncbi:hypothetical protein HBZS_120540 [Helicobacter bizzozeronii CCUG 35545]|uniref:OMP300 n=1 Tax=Helicobacter bizzozeronii TaxID=56877 RepID=A0A1M4NGV7_HELBI|nr:outer membrane beta-barrel protein [Helicobacter bizzozeronii]CCF81603.1 hypothetical protein HBZS_120540 [Helicobacter bizzozeronii CCUG 35545]SFZ71512.1 OMP300 [Helicobacter bizzozeronii]